VDEYKQVVLIRTDLGMSTGKKCAQACHASVSSSNKVRQMQPAVWNSWINSGQKKIILKAKSLEQLEEIHRKLERAKIPNVLINDAGLTQLAPGTTTALGIGPVQSSEVDKITGDLKLL
jgi:PTH2 family peptidyl-tRNA hydrolase